MADSGKKGDNFNLAAGSHLTLRGIPMPADAISDDYISAGWLLSEMDKAGGWHAHQYANNRTVTVGIETMTFKKPVRIGDLVTFYTEIVKLGRTSLVVKVESFALRRGTNTEEKVTEGYFAFVAIDSSHKPVDILNRAAAGATGYSGFARPAANVSAIPKDSAHLGVRMIPMPRDTNHIGDIFGGWILANMDLAGSKTAQPYAAHTAVTVGIESMSFHKPVTVGDEVSFYTQVVHTGRTSIGVKVETWAQRRGNPAIEEKVTEGVFTYVSVDKTKKPVPLVRTL